MIMMERLERRKTERMIVVPPNHAGCARKGKGCRLSRLVQEKCMVETRIGSIMQGIVTGDDKTRAKGREALSAEGEKREQIMSAIGRIADKGSCEEIGDGISSNGKNGKAKEILKQHLSLEKAEAEGMIDDCIRAKKMETNLDAILENHGFQMEEERRLGRINRALEQLEAGRTDISLEGLMAAHKREHVENLMERAV